MKKDRFPEIIGITGGIGSGKSLVSRIVRNNGLLVYDCDFQAAIIMETDSRVIDSLINILGEKCFFNDGTLNKEFIAQKIFGSNDIRNQINELVHKAVRDDFKSFIHKNRQKELLFIESAILFSSKLVEFCDKIWMIDAEEKLRIKRVRERNGWNEKDIKARIYSQRGEFSDIYKYPVVLIKNDEDTPLLKEVLLNLEKLN